MKIAANIAGGILALIFAGLGLLMLLGLMPSPEPPPADSLAGKFLGAFGPSGYLTFVKVLEVIGGILVAIPKTRNFGLLVLGPIIVNIFAFHIFITQGFQTDPVSIIIMILIAVLPLFLLWHERRKFLALLN
jgi:putative oxidoreductase